MTIFSRAVLMWASIGVAGICITVGVALIVEDWERQPFLRHRRGLKPAHESNVRAVGSALLAVAFFFAVVAVVCLGWPG